MPKVDFKRVETDEEIENLEIVDGQLIYSKSGKTFMDYGDERIPTGSGGGSEIVISSEKPTNEDWKIWIDTNELNNLGSEVVDTLEGNETNKAPSVNAVNKLNTYVPEETQIGWYEFNGTKFPLYRKEITGTLGTTGNDDLGELPCEIIVDVKGRMVAPSGYKIPFQFYNSPTSFLSCALSATNHVMLYYSTNFNSGTYRLILEYVKSTATATIDEEV